MCGGGGFALQFQGQMFKNQQQTDLEILVFFLDVLCFDFFMLLKTRVNVKIICLFALKFHGMI